MYPFVNISGVSTVNTQSEVHAKSKLTTLNDATLVISYSPYFIIIPYIKLFFTLNLILFHLIKIYELLHIRDFFYL